MRIGFVSDVVYPFMKGGVERTEQREMASLAKSHDVHAFSLQLEGMKEEFVSEGVHYHAIGATKKSALFSTSGGRSISCALRFSTLLPFILYKRKLDVIVANAFPFVHLPVVKLYCMLTGCKLIIDVAEVWNREYWRSYLGSATGSPSYAYMKAALLLGDAYISNSSVTAKALADIGVPSDRIFTFSPIIDRDAMRRSTLGKKGYKRRVIFVGRLIRQKRLDRWLSVMKKTKGVRGTIIGEGPDLERITGMLSQMGISNRVSLHGPISAQEGLYEQIRDSAVMLHMSEREGFGAVIVESLSLGTPVILPSYTPVPEEVKRMCMVLDEKKIPAKISEIIRAKDKGRYLKNTDGLRQFETGIIMKEYAKIFRKLDLN